ncbi:esterase-like activity of phytase family protein [Sabulicella glaciei]|uniref:Esterase-like activity of phytase family protein n=1 Tax=Sabulicella glaciei TaxID=2984948 RepID=A0ABT3NV10_9PROT|nr:esterase-like activity of phytase family protein [Roseococcus sp. MDT2-1-1]
MLDTTPWGFGGFSGAHLARDMTLTVVSDRGRWWQARLHPDPLAISEIRHGPLLNTGGRPLVGGAGDAEALAQLPDGSWLVGFERRHRIWRYQRLDGPARRFPSPPGLEDAPNNGGLESLTLLPDGRLLAIAESLGSDSLRAAWLGNDAGWEERLYRPARGFSPTDAAALPNGGALVLERDFSLFGGFRSRLAHVADLSAPVLEGETWLEMPGDAPAENWEAVSVTRTREGVLVVLLSDDNQNPFQRSLLALYRLG